MTAESIIASIFVSGAGYVLFSYGKKQQRLPQMVCGVALLVFPYFVPDVLWMLLIGVLLLALLWAGLKFGL